MCPVICGHFLWPWFYYGSLLSGPWSILCLACFGQCLEPHLSFISGISILNRQTSTTTYLSGPAKSRTIHPESRLQDAGSLHLRAEPVDVCLRMTKSRWFSLQQAFHISGFWGRVQHCSNDIYESVLLTWLHAWIPDGWRTAVIFQPEKVARSTFYSLHIFASSKPFWQTPKKKAGFCWSVTPLRLSCIFNYRCKWTIYPQLTLNVPAI